MRIIDRVAEAMRSVVTSVVVVANSEAAASWIPEAGVVRDKLSGGGSAAGIHAALSELQAPILAVAWDMPFVSSALLQMLATHGATGDFDAVIPEGATEGMLEPLCAWYALSFSRRIESAWPSRGLHDLLRDSKTYIVSRQAIATIGDPARLLFNVNTAADLSAARAMSAQ